MASLDWTTKGRGGKEEHKRGIGVKKGWEKERKEGQGWEEKERRKKE